jgi:hypothetical protein
MKRSLVVVLVSVLAALSRPADGVAQVMVGVGGGVTLPTGDYGDYAKTGWIGHAGVGLPLGDVPVTIGAYGFYGSNSHEPPPDGDKTSLYGGLVGVQYGFGDPEGVSPYVGGMVGLMTHSYESETQPSLEASESGLAAGPIVGVNFPLGRVGGLVEAWWLTGFGGIDRTQVGGMSVGVAFPLGSGGT